MVKRVVVTGAAGNIAYSLLFRIANGDLFGPNEPVILHLLEIPAMKDALTGVEMELQDCAFPLLQDVVAGTNAKDIFKDVDVALLVGSKPRGPGMERKDLIQENGKIFVGQGEALNDVASKDVKVLVVGNPCNTNCLIAMHHAPTIPKKNFMAMTRLDQNRAMALLAKKSGKAVSDVSNVCIWGNHSSTQVPDFTHANIAGQSAEQVIGDRAWLEGEFIETVQKRGAAIIKARGSSSAASAANAAIDSVRSLLTPTPQGTCFSAGVSTVGNPYGIDEDLIFSFPLKSDGKNIEIIPGYEWDSFLEQKIRASEKELQEERELVRATV